jgi:hypothetical protein
MSYSPLLEEMDSSHKMQKSRSDNLGDKKKLAKALSKSKSADLIDQQKLVGSTTPTDLSDYEHEKKMMKSSSSDSDKFGGFKLSRKELDEHFESMFREDFRKLIASNKLQKLFDAIDAYPAFETNSGLVRYALNPDFIRYRLKIDKDLEILLPEYDDSALDTRSFSGRYSHIASKLHKMLKHLQETGADENLIKLLTDCLKGHDKISTLLIKVNLKSSGLM